MKTTTKPTMTNTTTNRGHLRNLGIVAHVDAGKTTVTERLLYFTGAKHATGEVHEGRATTDFDPREQRHGITISSATTSVSWRGHRLNLIDTPGHIDFNIEVKRALRVLDGAVVVLDAVAGVEPQTETNWRLADEFGVPRIVFVNKLDRAGADFDAVCGMMRERLGVTPLPLQLPLGSGKEFEGVIDLVRERGLRWPDADGRDMREGSVSARHAQVASKARERLVEAAILEDDALTDAYLEGHDPTVAELVSCLRRGTIRGSFVPVLCGTALRNRGIQPLLDAIVDLLPSPEDRRLAKDARADRLAAYAFKSVSLGSSGTLTLARVYAGELRAGDTVLNSTRDRQERIGRLVEMHADRLEPRERAAAGEIIGIVGLKHTLTGDTLCAPDHEVVLERLAIPEPVTRVSIEVASSEDRQKLTNGLHRLVQEDPTLRLGTDPETGQSLLGGMGELHLEMAREKQDRLPSIVDFLGDCDAAVRDELLFELIHIDLRFRWYKYPLKGGSSNQIEQIGGIPIRPAVADYLNHFPELGSTATVPAELLAIEFQLRNRFDSRVDLNSFCQGYGRKVQEVRFALDALQNLETDQRNQLTEAFETNGDTPVASSVGSKSANNIGEIRGGRFVLLREYARGGMGIIYEAHDRELFRTVAVKELQDQFVENDDLHIRFSREAEITGKLEHPGIPPVYTVGEYANGRPYYAMKLITGESFATAIERFHRNTANGIPGASDFDSVEFRQLLSHVLDLCNTIDFAHRKGYLHRDIKPSNIHIDRFGETVLLDWGLATSLQEKDVSEKLSHFAELSSHKQHISTYGSVCGTLSYMSPEQAMGNEVDQRSDLFSIGATLYTVLVGNPAITRQNGETNEDVVRRIVRGEWRAPSSQNPKIPKAVNAICEKAMNVDPANRYASAREIAEDLSRFLAFKPVSVWRESYSDRVGRWERRYPWLRLLVLSVVCVMVIAVGGLTSLSLQLRHKGNEAFEQRRIANRSC